MARYRIALFLISITYCFGANAEIQVANNTVTYVGTIGNDLNQAFFQQVAGKEVNRLVIASDGGDVEAGIALGRWVFDNGIDIEVRDYCLSSCANYVFTAGRNKTIKPGALVAWHGNYNHLLQTGLWRDDITYRMQRTGEDRTTATRYAQELVARLVAAERDFFTHIGVDEYICWIGKMAPYNARDYYFLGREDMARFGVSNVQVPQNYSETRASLTDLDILFLKLK